MASRLKARIQGVLLGVLLAFPLVRSAEATVIFTYFAQCLENCAAIGLSDGDKLGIEARFGFTDHSVTPNAVLRTGDVLSFSGRFGDLSFDLDDLAFFIGELDDMAREMLGSLAIGVPGPGGGFLILRPPMDLDILAVVSPQGQLVLGSNSSFIRTGSVPTVPEPATLLLLTTALGAVAALSRRREKQISQCLA